MFYSHCGERGRQHVPVGLCPVYFYDDRWPGHPIRYLTVACCQKGFNAIFIRGVNAYTPA